MIKGNLKIVLAVILVAGVVACNRDNIIVADAPEKPETPEVPAPDGDFDDVFAGPSYFYRSTVRYTYAGRPVYLTPLVEGKSYKWTVDGRPVDCVDRCFRFTPSAPGDYTVGVSIDGDVNGEVLVVCMSGNEKDNYRSGSSDIAMVYEYVPAPGQFINESVATMTPDEAAAWAAQRLADGEYVSLGGFGGYIIVGFGHSIGDFVIKGNAYTNKGGASNEPGIVYVMQDVNGNGLPDDEWYELRASETGKATSVQNYAVTYSRPSAPSSPVEWTDCFGESGQIDYIAAIHKQPYYYPSWIDDDEYTLRGTLVQTDSYRNDAGQWVNPPLESGYADNTGDNDDHFYIADAMYADLSPVDLRYVDFIKIQTGVNGKCGILGELSTEICKVTLK